MATIKEGENSIIRDGEALVSLAVSSQKKEFKRLCNELKKLGFYCFYYLDESSHDKSDFILQIRKIPKEILAEYQM